jgi:CubicO group peptidase (beta-lactamase class C family)
MLAIALLLAAYFPPPDSSGGWRKRVDRRFDPVFEYVQTTTKHGGLLIAREGWLVYERYFGKGNREATPNTASIGKCFTSIAVGILLDERPDLFPRGLDTEVFHPRYLPLEALNNPAKRGILLGQLLSMSAGIRGNNPGYVLGKPVAIDPPGPDGWSAMVDRNALDTGLWTNPGQGYSYATASVHIASIVLRRACGMELGEYLRKRIAEPLGWGRWGFGYKRPEVDHTPGGGGIAARAPDMLRFAYLLLNGGKWSHRQVVPEAYVRACGRPSPYNPHYPYSYQFNVNADRHVAGVPRDAFWKSGSGGHALYVVPSLRLAVWKLGGRDDQYSQANTGLPALPYDGSREAWKPGDDADTALLKTLRMIVERCDDPAASDAILR